MVKRDNVEESAFSKLLFLVEDVERVTGKGFRPSRKTEAKIGRRKTKSLRIKIIMYTVACEEDSVILLKENHVETEVSEIRTSVITRRTKTATTVRDVAVFSVLFGDCLKAMSPAPVDKGRAVSNTGDHTGPFEHSVVFHFFLVKRRDDGAYQRCSSSVKHVFLSHDDLLVGSLHALEQDHRSVHDVFGCCDLGRHIPHQLTARQQCCFSGLCSPVAAISHGN